MKIVYQTKPEKRSNPNNPNPTISKLKIITASLEQGFPYNVTGGSSQKPQKTMEIASKTPPSVIIFRDPPPWSPLKRVLSCSTLR